MLNLKHLYYYHIFLQEQSTTAAAKRLSITPPALSNQLKQLEDFLGFKLTKRNKGKLIVTENGKMVAHYADRMFSVYTDLKNRVSLKEEVGTCFRIGISDNLGVRFSFDLLALVVKSQLLSAKQSSITFGAAEKILADFREGQQDLILGAFSSWPEEESISISQKLSFPVRLFAPHSLIKLIEDKNNTSELSDLDLMIE